jgi:hypothetical protein
MASPLRVRLRDAFRRLIEDKLPWYDPVAERLRDMQSERRDRIALAAREQAARVIESYERDDEGRQR